MRVRWENFEIYIESWSLMKNELNKDEEHLLEELQPGAICFYLWRQVLLINQILFICRETNISSRPIEISNFPNPPTIDHSLDSPFTTVAPSQSIVSERTGSPVLLPPAAFTFDRPELKSPLSSRSRIHQKQKRITVPHRPYSTQPTGTVPVDKNNLLQVKQRLEVYLQKKAELK